MRLESHSPEEERSPWAIAAVALVAGLLQIIASIVLGLARLEKFTAAANEGAYIYLVVGALLGAGVFSVWVVRSRPQLAVTLALVWPAGVWYGLRAHTSTLGLAYHGEYILHHLSALLCLVLAISVPIGWAKDRRLGKLAFVPLLLALPGALALAASHLGQVPVGPTWLADHRLATIGAALLLASWPVAAALFWSELGPRQRRPLVFVLLLPLAVRVGFAGWDGLSGALVEPEAIPWVGAALVVTAIATLILLRPRLELWVMAVVGVICLLASMFFYFLYENGFGELEDGLGGLLQSLFGFAVPYPSYVDDLRSAALMMGLFFMFVTVYSALVSAEDRVRGIALGLMVIAGLGFSSPHLVLMFGVGALLVVEGMLPGAPHRELGSRQAAADAAAIERALAYDDGPPRDLASVRELIEGLAERLGLDPPTAVETESGAGMIGLRGELLGPEGRAEGGPVLDLRARVEPGSTRIELSVGLPGREEPVFELVPDPGKRGRRPDHLLSRSHRVHGELRALEAFGDAPLDALTSFPTAYLRAWDGGVDVDLGRELVGLRVDQLDALVRSVAKALEPAQR
ncbi:hypothetical protein ENSA5_25740 [Enhygromyxa salina]|uniref:Uncharacterized protein n=1 Tax=Enhygromyxa salina TaxID=215803 RepID=A0A2S9YAJ1_9BACT|nr:hypothetical protein [Enhygromyxa salina]PRQ02115.1 hypothetical protein ENSA5_25740 [Enhygromyxa salina]